MVSGGVFVSGRRRLTNGMLTDLRAAGVYEGRAVSMRRRPAAGHDRFALETAAIRMLAGLEWREQDWLAPTDVGDVAVRFFVVGHERFDPDSYVLLAKPAIDGMADALGLSDRKWLCDVGGRVAQRPGEVWYPGFGEGEDGEQRVNVGGPGFWMDVCSWGAL